MFINFLLHNYLFVSFLKHENARPNFLTFVLLVLSKLNKTYYYFVAELAAYGEMIEMELA